MPSTDPLLLTLADYVDQTSINSDAAFDVAQMCLYDSMGCAMLALNYPACERMLGPDVPGATLTPGARVPGTEFETGPGYRRI